VGTQRLWTGAREGWGITSVGSLIYVSDGSEYLTKVDAANMQSLGQVRVTNNGLPVRNLNELEYCPKDGLIYANIWYQNIIVAIDPESGIVQQTFDFTDFKRTEVAFQRQEFGKDTSDVLNGIAYDAQKDTFFVTGKEWNLVFEVALI
jgi:glutamine cyclotransferase